MKLSIITICYNDKAGFEKTAKSVIAQTFDDFEWIIVDGASTDGSVSVIEVIVAELKEKRPSIHVDWKSEPDKGIYNAMNKGVSRSSGDYCLFLNSGDYLSSPKSLSRVMAQSLRADIVSCDLFVDIQKRWFPINYAPKQVCFQRIITGQLSHQSTFISRKMFETLNYNENFKIFSDVQFWFESLIVKGCSYQAINIPISVFDMTGVSNQNHILGHDERREFLSKYFNPSIIERVLSDSQWKYSWFILNTPFWFSVYLRQISILTKKIFDMTILRADVFYKNLRYRG